MTTPMAPIDAFINPFLKCTSCSAAVTWHKEDGITNHPCGHRGVRSVCMTWSPAAGCICRERFGTLTHTGPSEVTPLPAKAPTITVAAPATTTTTTATGGTTTAPKT